VDTRPGDVFLLCSDGLTTMVDDSSILAIVQKNRTSLDKAARALVDAANKGGGEDNITLVLFEIGEEGANGIEETATLPAVTEDTDEDTLTEADRVPAIEDTTLMRRDELDAMTRQNSHNGHHRRVSRTAIVLGSSTLVVVLAALVVWSLSRSYFVGAEANGKIAVYQGFPWDIAGGVRLYRLRYESPVLAGELSQPERRKLFGHDLRSYDAAVQAVKLFEAEVVP
jgi:protein phosphatase